VFEEPEDETEKEKEKKKQPGREAFRHLFVTRRSITAGKKNGESSIQS
jgi:hypothetical protein